jgi:hypothetical protein
MSVVVVISQHLLNVFVQLANKRGLKKMDEFKTVPDKTVVEDNYVVDKQKTEPDKLYSSTTLQLKLLEHLKDLRNPQ